MTHAELVDRARRWLTERHAVVVTEIVTQVIEQPDALGWDSHGRTTLVECKTSIEDFRRDKDKPFRSSSGAFMGVGSNRYYMAPSGLLTPEMLPKDWGLLSVAEKRVSVVRHANPVDSNFDAEQFILLSIIKRIGRDAPKGISIKCFTHQTRCKATLSVDPTENEEETSA